MDLRFEQAVNFNLLWGVLALALLLWGFLAWRGSALRRFASERLWPHVVPHFSRGRPQFKAVLLISAMVLLVVAAADPRWGAYWQDVPRKGLDVFFVLDVSKSMLAQDVKPSRLERAKEYIRDMLAEMGGDRVGLVTFAGTTSLSVPLTSQFGAFKMTLDEIGPQSVSRGGSLLGDAIRKAADSFVDSAQGHKAIVIFTDGEDHDSFPLEAAKQAYAQKGIRIYTVGLGDAGQGARVPVAAAGGATRYMLHEQQEVWSKMNPGLLEKIALSAGGAYVPAGTKLADMSRVYRDTIGTLEKREFEQGRVEKRHAQFQWFLAPALALLLLETFIRGYSPKLRGEEGQVKP